MQEHFTQETVNLKNNLLRMASIVDEMVEKSIAVLETGSIDNIKHIKAKDLEVDAYDNLIQTQCENILAIFQPFASDLRFIISSIMINNQLERCGDIAVNIAQRRKKIGENQSIIVESNVLEMGQKAKEMLKNVIDAFIHGNSEIARLVMESDSHVDKLNKHIFKYATDKMKSDPQLIDACSHLIVLSKHIERLADHATNIAENIIFYLEAKVVAHEKKLKVAKKNEDQ